MPAGADLVVNCESFVKHQNLFYLLISNIVAHISEDELPNIDSSTGSLNSKRFSSINPCFHIAVTRLSVPVDELPFGAEAEDPVTVRFVCAPDVADRESFRK